jgi:type VI protein secretion system component Hcp
MNEEQKSQQADDRVEDLEVRDEEAKDVKGGLTSRKAGKGQQEYLEIKLEDVQISSY